MSSLERARGGEGERGEGERQGCAALTVNYEGSSYRSTAAAVDP